MPVQLIPNRFIFRAVNLRAESELRVQLDRADPCRRCHEVRFLVPQFMKPATNAAHKRLRQAFALMVGMDSDPVYSAVGLPTVGIVEPSRSRPDSGALSIQQVELPLKQGCWIVPELLPEQFDRYDIELIGSRLNSHPLMLVPRQV